MTNKELAVWLKGGVERQYKVKTEDIVYSSHNYHWGLDNIELSNQVFLRDGGNWFSHNLIGKETKIGLIESAKDNNGPYLIGGKWVEYV